MSVCMKISVFERVSLAAVDFDDGKALLEEIRPHLNAGEVVELDFEGIQIYASPFFNGSVGILVSELAPKPLSQCVKLVNLNQEGETIANLSIENAKTMNDPEKQKRLAAALEEEEGD